MMQELAVLTGQLSSLFSKTKQPLVKPEAVLLNSYEGGDSELWFNYLAYYYKGKMC